MRNRKSTTNLSTISKAFHVLEVVAQSDFPMRFSDILLAVPYPKTTLHRLLKLLQDERMLRLTGSTNRYAVGYRPMRMAYKSWDRASLKDAAADSMAQLNQLSKETVHLGVLEGYQVLYVGKHERERATNTYSNVGKLSPAYCTGIGKVMLAYLPEAEINNALQMQNFERRTSHTITNPKELQKELATIRERGFALELEEYENDTLCIAAPILSRQNSILGALSVTAPMSRVDVAQITDWSKIVCEAAQSISESADTLLPPPILAKKPATKFDVLVVGELNIDLILDGIAHLPQLGKEILANEMSFVMGSSSAILASNLASLGAQVVFAGLVGNDAFGDFAIESLKSRGVDTQFVSRDENGRTGMTVCLNYQDERAMVTQKGVMDCMTLADLKAEHFESSRHLHLSSYYLQEGIRKDCPELFEAAKNAGLTTSFDTNWDPRERWGPEVFDVLRHVDVFLPNRYEALLISKQDSIDAALETLSKYSTTVVIKLGKDGVIAKHGDEIFRIKPHEVVAVDAIGAGDSFNAGFLYRYLKGKDIQQCLELGNACGALSVTSTGGTSSFRTPLQIERDMADMLSYAVNLKAE